MVASFLLPRRLRQPFYNIYAFCRTADDVADESPTPQKAISGLESLQGRVDEIYAGQTPPEDLFPALAGTIRQFGLSKRHFDDLLSAFRQDQHQQQYATNDELIDYCQRSANPVGKLVLELADALNPATEVLSDRICTGLQQANFWQDVARDFQIGRVYLPLDRCEAFGVDVSQLGQSSTPTSLRSLLQCLCDETEALFREGLPLADQVPPWLASDIRLFAHGGLETLNAIRKVDFDVLHTRPTVTKWTQMSLVAKAALGWL